MTAQVYARARLVVFGAVVGEVGKHTLQTQFKNESVVLLCKLMMWIRPQYRFFAPQ